jgi:hypothetical protein
MKLVRGNVKADDLDLAAIRETFIETMVTRDVTAFTYPDVLKELGVRWYTKPATYPVDGRLVQMWAHIAAEGPLKINTFAGVFQVTDPYLAAWFIMCGVSLVG